MYLRKMVTDEIVSTSHLRYATMTGRDDFPCHLLKLRWPIEAISRVTCLGCEDCWRRFPCCLAVGLERGRCQVNRGIPQRRSREDMPPKVT